MIRKFPTPDSILFSHNSNLIDHNNYFCNKLNLPMTGHRTKHNIPHPSYIFVKIHPSNRSRNQILPNPNHQILPPPNSNLYIPIKHTPVLKALPHTIKTYNKNRRSPMPLLTPTSNKQPQMINKLHNHNYSKNRSSGPPNLPNQKMESSSNPNTSSIQRCGRKIRGH